MIAQSNSYSARLGIDTGSRHRVLISRQTDTAWAARPRCGTRASLDGQRY